MLSESPLINQFYLISNSISTSRLLLAQGNNLGGSPASLKSFFIALYEHPVFQTESRVLETDDSFNMDLKLNKIREELSEENYFKKALSKRGIRHLVIQAINECYLSGFIENKGHLDKLKLSNQDKGEGLKELLTLGINTRQTIHLSAIT